VGKWRRRGLRAPFCHGGRFCGQKSPPARAGGSSSAFASKEMSTQIRIKITIEHSFVVCRIHCYWQTEHSYQTLRLVISIHLWQWWLKELWLYLTWKEIALQQCIMLTISPTNCLKCTPYSCKINVIKQYGHWTIWQYWRFRRHLIT